MPMPAPDHATRDHFKTLLPEDAGVTVRPMFGHTAAFVNGNMFSGTFGSQIFVRLPEDARAELLAQPGAGPFAPMEGRPMAGYVVMPDSWREAPDRAREWIERSLEFVGAMPPKESKKKG